MVLDMAAKGELINGALKPLRFLDCGSVGFFFVGIRQKDKKPVTIKFIKKNDVEYAQREYEMYSHMKAINKPGVEKYGITAVYYYATWKNFFVTAYTDLEETLANRIIFGSVETYDILLVMQQFVRTFFDHLTISNCLKIITISFHRSNNRNTCIAVELDMTILNWKIFLSEIAKVSYLVR